MAVATATPPGFGTLFIPAALSGVAVLGGGAIFSLLGETYPDAGAPAAVGYAAVSGGVATFVAPSPLGWVIRSTGSFADASWVFAAVEAAPLVILVAIARSPAGRTGAVAVGSGA